jgi:antagonist of KipI
MSLRVLEPGLFSLVVDLGRPGWRSLGVPAGGAADREALILGNALVGNPAGSAALEITMTGPTLEAGSDLAAVLFGAPFRLSSDRQDLTVGTTFNLTAGEKLQIGGTPLGARAYLCVVGGLKVPEVLGSRSGLAPVAADTELPCQPAAVSRRFLPGRPMASWPRGGLPDYLGSWRRLRVLPGPQADWFAKDVIYQAPEADVPALPPRFTVSPASNRMGLRLLGTPLPVPDRELVSEPVCAGSVQVTRDGQCIILGVDGQTIGGYPKIAQVIAADLDLLGQLRPGEQLAFVPVGLAEAEDLYQRRRTELRHQVVRLRETLAARQ